MRRFMARSCATIKPTHTYLQAPSRWFSSQRKRKNVPLLKDSLKKVYLKTHPDLFENFPEHKHVNQESLQSLQGLLESMKDNTESYPPKQHLSLDFHYRSGGEDGFKKVTLNISTTGGECKRIVGKGLSKFFVQFGLPDNFKWGDSFWKTPTIKDAIMEEQKRQQKEMEQKYREAYEKSTGTNF
ncbi:hypothetical protein AAMO2058_000976200 [Amorphochlora amoebiformis]